MVAFHKLVLLEKKKNISAWLMKKGEGVMLGVRRSEGLRNRRRDRKKGSEVSANNTEEW